MQYILNFTKIWGQSGLDPGQFSMNKGIYVHTDFGVFIADVNNSRIQVFELR